MKHLIIPDNLNDYIREAMKTFWDTRAVQSDKQQESGGHDQGNRSAVTGGKQLDGFVNFICEILKVNGIPQNCIYADKNLELPGYYRPNKKWDLLVVKDNILVIAIEFKSQIGPSFGNNFNNRTEEAMGSALDVWTAYREGVFGKQNPPWIGYFMLLEDCPRSNEPVKARSPHFSVLPEFKKASYVERYDIFCHKLLLERPYSAACFATTGIDGNQIYYNFPSPDLSLKSFITSMLGSAALYF